LEYNISIQRIRFNLDQKLTVFSQNPVLMIQYFLSFCVSFLIISFFGTTSLSADNLNSMFTDSIPPAPTLNAGSLNVGGPFTVGVGFSEAVYGLTVADFFIENGAVLEVTGEAMSFTVLIDPLAVGVVRFKVPAGVAVDEAGNQNLASGTLSVTFTDEEEPMVVLSTPQNSVDTEFPVTVEFNEPVTGLEISDFNISNGAGVSLMGSDMSYTLTVNPGAVGAVSIFLPAAVTIDTAGNPNLVSNFLQVNFGPLDVTAPEVTLSTSMMDVSEAFITEIRFSEEITDLEIADFSVENADLSNLAGNGNVFTILVNPLLEGEVRLQLNAETVVDLFGNPNGMSNELVVNYLVPLAPDTIRPTVFLEEILSSIEGEYEIEIEFSETVSELSIDDLNLTNAVVSSFIQNSQIYNLKIMAIDFGTIGFSIPENVVTDDAGNGNLASTNLSWEYIDNTPVDPDPVFDIVLSRVEDAIQIDWFTNTEVENAYFEIWHSGDGINYVQIEEIESTGNTTGLVPYTTMHETPVFGLNHYYARQYDQSGDYVDSKVVIIEYIYLGSDALVYPNPATNMITFNTTDYAGIRCEIMIYNTLGQIFLLDVYEELPNTPIEVDITNFQAGVYGVQFWIKETARVESSFLIMR